MSVKISPQAIVSTKAILDEGVEIGPFAVVEDNVRIGKNTKIYPYVHLAGYTTIGQDCKIFSSAVIGSAPQDLKYKDCVSYVNIGDNNIIREFVTVNPGTNEGEYTTIGSNNLIMAYSHIAHNCKVGDNCILANAATLAGHVELDSRVIIGGMTAIHQFCRIGYLAIIGGCSKVVQDVPPFSMSDGHPVKVYGLNLVGLKRAGFSYEKVKILKEAFKILFFQKHTLPEGLVLLEKEFGKADENIERLINFINSSCRGVCK